MKGLLIKQWFQISARKGSLLLPLLFLIVFYVNPDDIIFSLMPLLMMISLTESCYTQDETSGWLTYQKTLPVSNRTLVGSYYLFTILMALVVFLFQFVSILFMKQSYDYLLRLILMVSVLTMSHALTFYEIIRFGNEKIRLILLGNMGILFIVLAAFEVVNFPVISSFSISTPLLMALFVLLGILAELVSFFASVRLYDRNRMKI